MTPERIAAQVNARRTQRGREPLQTAHILRVIRLVFGCAPKQPRSPLFQRKNFRPNLWDLPIPYRLTEKGRGE